MSYYVNAQNRNGSTTWGVVRDVWSDGKRAMRRVPKDAVKHLGFNPEWSVDQAREHVKTLNLKAAHEREAERKVAAFTRAATRKRFDSAFLPVAVCEAFETEVIQGSWGIDPHDDRGRVFIHWETVQEMIAKLGREPKNWGANPHAFYTYFREQQWSVDYCRKLLRMLNEWGKFYSRSVGNFFEPVPVPTGRDRAKISDTQRQASGRRTKSDPLTYAHLTAATSWLSEENAKWLYVAIAFGLRPEEVDNLISEEVPHDERATVVWRIDPKTQKKFQALRVYQPKLVAVEHDMRYKFIELKYPDQRVATGFIKDAKLKRPLDKTMAKFPGHITTYGGRKNFTDMMHIRRDEPTEKVAQWLGHRSMSTLEAFYQDWQGLNAQVFDGDPDDAPDLAAIYSKRQKQH